MRSRLGPLRSPTHTASQADTPTRSPGSANMAPMPADSRSGTWVIDLDGVIWLATQPISGSSEAVEKIRAAGVRVLFCTNNAATTSDALIDRLAAAGIRAGKSDLVTSAQAAATLLDPGSKAFVCGEKGILEALADRGVEVVSEAPAAAVIVGWTRSSSTSTCSLHR